MRTRMMASVVSLVLASGMIAGLDGAVAATNSAIVTPQGGHAQEPVDKASQLNAMIGKQVLGKSREYLGILASVNGEKKTAQMKTPTGAVVPLSIDGLSIEQDHVRAANVSRGDIIVLMRQTGQSGTVEAGVLGLK